MDVRAAETRRVVRAFSIGCRVVERGNIFALSYLLSCDQFLYRRCTTGSFAAICLESDFLPVVCAMYARSFAAESELFMHGQSRTYEPEPMQGGPNLNNQAGNL